MMAGMGNQTYTNGTQGLGSYNPTSAGVGVNPNSVAQQNIFNTNTPASLSSMYKADNSYTPDDWSKIYSSYRGLMQNSANNGYATPSLMGSQARTGPQLSAEDADAIGKFKAQNPNSFLNPKDWTDTLSKYTGYGIEGLTMAGLAYGGAVAAGAGAGTAGGVAAAPAAGETLSAPITMGSVAAGGSGAAAGAEAGSLAGSGLGGAAGEVGAGAATAGAGGLTAAGAGGATGTGLNALGASAAAGVSPVASGGAGGLLGSLAQGAKDYGPLISSGLSYLNANKTNDQMQDILNQQKAIADPFGTQRPQYQQQLSDLINNPTSFFDTPVVKYANEAAARKSASMGYNLSPTQAQAVQESSIGEYNKQVQNLSALAGANISPNGSSLNGAGTNAVNSQLNTGDSLANLIRVGADTFGKQYGNNNNTTNVDGHSFSFLDNILN